MKFKISNIKKRLNEFLPFFLNEREKIKKDYEALKVRSQHFSTEEKLYYLFLVTHFGNFDSAIRFYQELNWKEFLEIEKITEICKIFFLNGIPIGDHRKHFRCMNTKKRVEYTLEILESYKKVIRKYNSQINFFEINQKPIFDSLYQRMIEIKNFHTRLPRFDHLENLSRLFDFYTIPKRFYAEESTGPLDGLTYIIFGKRYRKNKTEFRKYFSEHFLSEWNSVVDEEYKIKQEITGKDILVVLEKWLIKIFMEILPQEEYNDTYIFDFESCLCNWQKKK